MVDTWLKEEIYQDYKFNKKLEMIMSKAKIRSSQLMLKKGILKGVSLLLCSVQVVVFKALRGTKNLRSQNLMKSIDRIMFKLIQILQRIMTFSIDQNQIDIKVVVIHFKLVQLTILLGPMKEAIKMSVQVDKNLASIKKVGRSVVTEALGQIFMLVVNSILVSHMILYSQNKNSQREF
jgi:hypothetical protein